MEQLKTHHLLLISLLLFMSPLAYAAPTIEVAGLSGEAEENVLNTIDLSQYSCDISEWRFKHLEQRFSAKANSSLRALGYYHPESKAQVSTNNGCWSLKLDVVSGTPTIVEAINITVSPSFVDNPEYQKFLKNLPLTMGDPVNHGKYEQIKATISSIATRYGYFNSYFATRKLEVDTHKNKAWIRIDFKAGDRFRFGKVNIDDTELSERLLKQYRVINEGMFYNADLLTKQQLLLINSQFFTSVSVNTEPENSKEKTIPVTIHLIPRKRKAYRVGIGASTDIGPRVSLSFENRRTNANGNQFKINTGLSERRKEFELGYSIPMGAAGKNRIDISGGYLSEQTDTSKKDAWKLALLRTRLSSSDWLHTSFIEYMGEDFKTADDENNIQLLMPGYQIQKTHADNLVYPRKGWRLNARSQFATDAIVSDISLFRITAGVKYIHPISKGRFLLRSDLGATETDDFHRTPVSLRFYAGGDGSLRGFGYQTLGPVNDSGEVIGGKYLASNSIEYEHPVRETWGIAVFSDFGNSFDNVSDFEFESSVGFGIRWHSPIGPIRFDLAQDLKQKHGIRFHLSMGPDL